MKERTMNQIADLFVVDGIGGFRMRLSKDWLTLAAAEFDITYFYI